MKHYVNNNNRLSGGLGTNQSGMRARNEKLILALLRSHDGLAKSEIAKLTGLTSQTASVIMRQLESDGLIVRGEPVRGKVGQPQVPMALNPDGAYFFGLKIGRRSFELILIDFVGNIHFRLRETFLFPKTNDMLHFVQSGVERIRAEIKPQTWDKIEGLGVAMPYGLWNWVEQFETSTHEAGTWQYFDLIDELSKILNVPIYVENDATSACGAELVFGAELKRKNALYFYIAHFIGGGTILEGKLYSGASGNSGAVASMPVLSRVGSIVQLANIASLSHLEKIMKTRGENSDNLFLNRSDWHVSDEALEEWLDQAAEAIAYATIAGCSIIDFEDIIIDASTPVSVRDNLVARVAKYADKINHAGINLPQVSSGHLGVDAGALGAALLPLAQKYLPE